MHHLFYLFQWKGSVALRLCRWTVDWTGYSMSSISESSMPYDDHFITPEFEPSSNFPDSTFCKIGLRSLNIRRPRRHSQAMSPYPSPYEDQRPSPHALDDHQASTIPMIQLVRRRSTRTIFTAIHNLTFHTPPCI